MNSLEGIPLLTEEGNALSRQFIHTFYDRRYSGKASVHGIEFVNELLTQDH